MLDQNAVKLLLEEEIRREVQSAVSQEQWLADLENQIVEFVQARIVAKFSNIGTIPDLVETVERSVQKLFADGFVPNIENLVDNTLLSQAVDLAVENLVEQTISNMTADTRWVDKVQNLVTQTMSNKLSSTLREIDLNQKLESIVLEHKDLLVARLKENFETTGIRDQASDTQLTVMDDVVVVEKELAATSISTVENLTVGSDLTVTGDLAIKGRINTDSPNWNELADRISKQTYAQIKNDFSHDLVTELLDLTKQGINFNSVQVEGEQLVLGGKLASTVKSSSLTEVGKIKNLRLQGRLGINTDNPDHAITLWDDEVSIGIGKFSENTAFVGTNKKQNLHIGVNQKASIQIDSDGDVWVKNLQVGRNKIGHSQQAPGHEGAKGDILFNINYKEGGVFAWICLGAYRWAELSL